MESRTIGQAADRAGLGAETATKEASWPLWAFPFGFVALGLFPVLDARVGWLWTLAFLVAGIGCVADAHRCSRAHCYMTGLLYLIAAVFSILQGMGLIDIGWTWILVGTGVGAASAYQVERIRGRYATQKLGRRSTSTPAPSAQARGPRTPDR